MGDDVPEDFIAPDLPEVCLFAHGAFHDLSADRQSGFGVGPIPWASINAYAYRYNIRDIDEFEFFAWMVRVMDNVFVAHHGKKET
jgi:hypothetical protein